nr:integrase, catalytic region, zinc finger, CCHC-type, peptidase aspartic, catalytic [Tanacetum cinerariifolium]
CPTRNERLSSRNHDSYVVQNWKPVNRKTITIKQVFQPVKQVVTPVKKVWKATGKVFARVGFHWQPTGRMFTLDDMCPLNSITSSKVLHVEHSSSVSTSDTIAVPSRFVDVPITCYQRQGRKEIPVFGNEEFATIVGYGDYKLGDTVITRVYNVEGLKHNLFSVGQFCDAGLEVAFRQPRIDGNPNHTPLGKYVAKKTAVPNPR